TPCMPFSLAQWAQQKITPSTSTPCPTTRHPQCEHTGARRGMAHSKLSNTCDVPPCFTVKLLSYAFPHTSQVSIGTPCEDRNAGSVPSYRRPPVRFGGLTAHPRVSVLGKFHFPSSL